MDSVRSGIKVKVFRKNILLACLGGSMFVGNFGVLVTDHKILKTPQDHNMYLRSYYFLFQTTRNQVA